MRLSEEQLDNAIAWSARAKGEFVASGIQPLRMTEFDELVRGYRRAAALEDMLREWVDSRGVLWADIPLLERTEGLLAEGDE